MIYDAIKERDETVEIEQMDPPLEIKELVMLSIATSIDALAVGVTLSFMETNIWLDIAIIGILTLFHCRSRRFCGKYFRKQIQIQGGVRGRPDPCDFRC